MPVFVSYRHVTYVSSDTGVRITIATDVPCHATLRVTTAPPLIHKKVSNIRGLPLKEDVRFCFTQFEDFDQYEGGDTIDHTFYIDDWEEDTTKYFYPISHVKAVASLSTGPVFEYKNTGLDPVPSPDAMYHLNSIDPELHIIGGGGAWVDIDLSYDVPLGASGVLIFLTNTNPGQENRVALRKPAAGYDIYLEMSRRSAAWVLVGLDADRKIQARAQNIGDVQFYVMAYTGPEVVYPDTPIDIKPSFNNTYMATNIHATWPDALLILTDLGSNIGFDTYHSIRPSGSSKEIYQGSFRKWPFSVVSPTGWIETKLYTRNHPTTQWLAYAYIPATVHTSLNGIDIGGLPGGAWTPKSATPLSALTRFAFIEMLHNVSSALCGIRKQHSFLTDTGASANHMWLITHVDDGQWYEMYHTGGVPVGKLLAATE